MKYTLLAIALGLKILFANEYFLLPDHSSDALYALKKRVDGAKISISFITVKKPDKQLFSAIRKALKRGVKLYVITTSSDLAASLAIYKNSRVRLLRTADSRSLKLNILLVDDEDVCSSGIDFADNSMRTNSAVFECSRDASKITFYRYVLKQLKSRSDDYFLKGKDQN